MLSQYSNASRRGTGGRTPSGQLLEACMPKSPPSCSSLPPEAESLLLQACCAGRPAWLAGF